MIAAGLIALGGTLGALGVHPFTTYPLSLAALARLRRPVPGPAAVPPGAPPRVALCVCAYNEEGVIRAKALNMLRMREAVPGLELKIYVDAASDRTAEILEAFRPDIDVHVAPARHGKTYGMNLLVASTTADIVVFSDANVTFADDAIPALLRAFGDDAVGCVCGHLIYTTSSSSATAATGSLYWRLEEAIKSLETRTGSTMGADGSIFAIRRALHVPPPADIIDDMFVSLSILCAGRRVVRVGDALAYEELASRPADEFRRKVRIACQAFNVHRLLRPRLRGMAALDRYKYVSHKLLRWFCIYLLTGAALSLAAGLALAGAWTLLGLALAAGAALLGWALLAPSSPAAKVLDIVGALAATGLGVLRSVQGDRFQVWTPPASARAKG